MAGISYRRHRFPPAIIQDAVWLYLRFTLSYRDVEELLVNDRYQPAPSVYPRSDERPVTARLARCPASPRRSLD
jgi:hypothetical protein